MQQNLLLKYEWNLTYLRHLMDIRISAFVPDRASKPVF